MPTGLEIPFNMWWACGENKMPSVLLSSSAKLVARLSKVLS
jgi:hypothetical protein